MRLQKYMVNETIVPSWILKIFNIVKSELYKMSFSEFVKKCENDYNKILLSVLKKIDTTNNKNQEPITYKISDILGKVFYIVGTTDKEKIEDKKFINLLLKTTKDKNIKERLFNLDQKLDINDSLRYCNRKEIFENPINEDAAHLWKLIKTEAFPTMSFYPALQVWLELDKVLKGTEYSGKVIGFYASFWLILISGKHIAQWMKWKKENPEQYKKEREEGNGGIL